jgi:hypothetical protein
MGGAYNKVAPLLRPGSRQENAGADAEQKRGQNPHSKRYVR